LSNHYARLMLVVTRLRAPTDAAALEEFRHGLDQAHAVLAQRPGYLGGEVGRNVDDPNLWVLSTRWENVGSYRRAIGSYDAKLLVQPFMIHAVDEPSAYEIVQPGTDLNEAGTRQLG
jgi:quinol monooxygenase YgiN